MVLSAKKYFFLVHTVTMDNWEKIKYWFNSSKYKVLKILSEFIISFGLYKKEVC